MQAAVLVLVLLALWAPSSEPARILGIWPMDSPSHFFLGSRLFKELAAQGHQVTMISPFPQKTPVKNYRDIPLTGIKQAMMTLFPNDKKLDLFGVGQLSAWQQQMLVGVVGGIITNHTLQQENVQKMLHDKNEKFDLIIFEMFYTEVLYGLSHHYDCPVIVLSTMGSSFWTNHLVANPAPSTYIPDLFTKFSGQMTYCQRMYNTLTNFFSEVYRKFFNYPNQNEIMHKYFPDAPHIEELMYNKTAMILLNSHSSITDPKPIVPAMVEIGGFHVQPPKALPKDLQDFMDSAKDGVILFSMGSNLQSVDLSEDKRNELLRTFSKLKQKVIWKWEDENLPGKPDNVKIMKWCPQSDIMAHPNLKLFITHGGLLSTTEAVYHGVPVIGLPIFGDQKMNVAMTTRKGFGIGIDFEKLTEATLTAALKEILGNSKYKLNAKMASALLHDQPVKPLDSAIFWIEHVIKHKGADHFRTSAMALKWYQIYSLDLIAAAVLADLVFFLIFYNIVKCLCCKKTTESENKNKDSQKKKS